MADTLKPVERLKKRLDVSFLYLTMVTLHLLFYLKPYANSGLNHLAHCVVIKNAVAYCIVLLLIGWNTTWVLPVIFFFYLRS